MAEQSDEQIAYAKLLASNTRRLYGFIRVLVLNDDHDAEDVFQSTCMTLWKKMDDFDPDGDFGAWACKIAYFKVLQHRDRQRRNYFLSDESLAALADAAQPAFVNVDQRREALEECLEVLPRKDRLFMHERYRDGRKPKELASRSAQSVAAIYRELNRVHGLLIRCVQRKMQERCNHGSI